MGVVGLLFALFSLGYIVGVWTAMLVLQRHQQGDDDVLTAPRSGAVVVVLKDHATAGVRRI